MFGGKVALRYMDVDERRSNKILKGFDAICFPNTRYTDVVRNFACLLDTQRLIISLDTLTPSCKYLVTARGYYFVSTNRYNFWLESISVTCFPFMIDV